MDRSPEEILSFWIDEIGPEGWYAQDEALDTMVREKFLDSWNQARFGAFGNWRSRSSSTLALIILLDQFPRNMFRGSELAFASDSRALSIACAGISMGFDEATEIPARQFFYLPFMHSESLPDQERAVRMFLLAGDSGGNLGHARAHRHVIRRFGRFPYRNNALSRASSDGEREFLDAGGYVEAMRAVGLS